MTVVGERVDKMVTVGTAVVVTVEKTVEIGGVLVTIEIKGGSMSVLVTVANSRNVSVKVRFSNNVAVTVNGGDVTVGVKKKKTVEVDVVKTGKSLVVFTVDVTVTVTACDAFKMINFNPLRPSTCYLQIAFIKEITQKVNSIHFTIFAHFLHLQNSTKN